MQRLNYIRILLVGLIALIPCLSLAQIDTLTMSSVNLISVTGGIKGYYIVDLQNDNLSEIVIIGTSFAYVYSYPDLGLNWTSPELSLPSNFQSNCIAFADMNGDGDKDMIIKETSSIQIFDMVHSQLLWTDQEINSGAILAVGDRNDDGYNDIAITWRGAFHNDNADDTAWVEILDGPDYFVTHTLLYNVRGSWDSGSNFNESPVDIRIENLTGANGIEPQILIFTTRSGVIYMPEDPSGFSRTMYGTGGIIIINGADLVVRHYDYTGSLLSCNVKEIDGAISFYAITKSIEHCIWLYGNQYYENSLNLRKISGDGIQSSLIWERMGPPPSYYGNYEPGNVKTGSFSDCNPGDELCFSLLDSIIMTSYPTLSRLWSRNYSSAMAIGPYHSALNFDSTQILAFPYTYNGSDGAQSAYIQSRNYYNATIWDFEADGDDEIIGIKADTFGIFHLTPYADPVDENSEVIPSQFLLSQNYPNPFNASTSISYNLTQSSDVVLDVFDIMGRKVESLVSGYQVAGAHKAIWNAGDMSSGIYVYKLTAGRFMENRKMLLIK